MIALLASLAGVAAISAAWIAAVVFAGVAALVIARIGQEAGRALAVLEHAMAELAKAAASPLT